jgi:predicted HicB family RNase H-like nuclease
MKRIIDGVTYNTDTATVIARAEVVDDEWPKQGERRVLTLYQTRGGAFFVHIDTTTMRFSPRDQEWQDDQRHVFEAMTREQAHAWVMDGQVELLNDVFGEPPEAAEEAAPGATIYLRIPASLKDQIETAANGDKLSVNAWTMRCIEQCLRRAAP